VSDSLRHPHRLSVLTKSGLLQDNRWGSEFRHSDTWSESFDQKRQLIYLKYNGVIDITPGLGAILSGRPDAKSTEMSTVIHLTFETGSERYRALETGVYVGAGRFVVGRERPVFVEYKVSRVVGGDGHKANADVGGKLELNHTR